jgi:RHS repeat-associated protein
VATTDAARNVLERTYYAPYGEALNRTVDGPGYTGHVMDAATGLVYAQQRYYDPLVGKFLSIDPVAADPGNGGNFNRYWYANDNPYKFTDPDGREGACVGTNGCASFANINPDTVIAVAGTVADFTPIVGDIKGIAEAIADPSAVKITAAVVGIVPGAGDVAGKVIKSADDVVEAAGGVVRASGDTVAEGGREAAKSLFREADSAGKGNRQIVKDKTGGGRAVVGKAEDGTPIRIRMKPDGTTRIQVGNKKIIFPENKK